METTQPQKGRLQNNPAIRRAPVFIAIATGLVLFTAAFFSWRNWETQKIVLTFQRNADQHISAINKKVAEIQVLLESVKALFLSSEVVEQKEFSEFVKPLLQRNPSVFSIEWVPRSPGIRPQEKEEVTPKYDLSRFDQAQTEFPQETDRLNLTDFFPVLFSESLGKNIRLPIKNLALEKNYRNAMQRACDTGRMIASDGFNLSPNEINPLNFRIFLPIYAKNSHPVSTEDRRRSLVGYISGIFKIPEILKHAWSELENENLLVLINETLPSGQKHFLYAYPVENSSRFTLNSKNDEMLNQSTVHQCVVIEEAGKKWELSFIALPEYVSSNREWTIMGVPLMVLFSTILLSILFQSILNKKKQLSDANHKLKQEIQEREALMAKLQQAQKMESIGTLAGGIAHDFNNILGVIIGYGELIKIFDATEDSQIKTSINGILAAANRAKDLVGQILTFSRQTDQERQPIKLSYIIKESVKFLRASIPSSIEIQCKIGKQTGIINANPTQMHQVLMNLGTNSAHAMRYSGGILEVKLENVDLDADSTPINLNLKPGAYLKLTVSDSGHGISQECLDRIFDPYFTTKQKGEGTGLGLAVVHGIVKSHEGAINVESKTGKGTTFELFFPVVAQSCKQLPKEKDTPLPGGQECILFVDDEQQLVAVGQYLLESLGYKVIESTSSSAALERFKVENQGIDLVITDMTMPKMTGFDLAREMKLINPEIPILLCTGFKKEATTSKLDSAGIKGVIEKPFLPSDLAFAVRQILDKGDLIPEHEIKPN